MPVSDAEVGGPSGHSYGAVIIPAAEGRLPDLQGALSGIRFSGWIAPPTEGYVVVLGDPGDGVVADGHRGVVEVGAMIAERATEPVLALRVRHDRQLALVAWRGGEELARYCSDPSREPGAGDDVRAEPYGAESAQTFADLWNRPDAAERLSELLEDELDPDSVYESERLGTTLRLLGLPAWIVAAGALPRPMPTGPRISELVRLRAGATGVTGRTRDSLVRPVRRRQHPPPVIADPPTSTGMDFESWMF